MAIDHLNFKIEKGQVYGFLGPNGAGKSTTMNIMTGYLGATEGEVLIDGHDILKEPNEAKKHIGYLPEIPPLYVDMQVMEYLEFAAELKGIPKQQRESAIDEVIQMAKLEDVKLRLQLESNEHFAGSMPLFDQMEIVFNNVISPPLWWKGDVIKLFLGTYSRKKYVDFVTFSGISDFGALSTAEKRQAALEFKYYVAANNIMDKDDKTGEEFPMVIPVD